jgi:hypothetical protein
MGRKGTFYLEAPLGQEPRGNAGGAPRVNGGSQRGNTVVTDGWITSTTGVLLKGDYIQISTGLHKVLNDVDSDSGGNATIDIWPKLAKGVADDEVIVTERCRGIFRLSSNILPLADMDEQRLFTIGFSCEEAK